MQLTKSYSKEVLTMIKTYKAENHVAEVPVKLKFVMVRLFFFVSRQAKLKFPRRRMWKYRSTSG